VRIRFQGLKPPGNGRAPCRRRGQSSLRDETSGFVVRFQALKGPATGGCRSAAEIHAPSGRVSLLRHGFQGLKSLATGVRPSGRRMYVALAENVFGASGEFIWGQRRIYLGPGENLSGARGEVSRRLGTKVAGLGLVLRR
jgi:hypothetical protein